jgi:hypothetical protein
MGLSKEALQDSDKYTVQITKEWQLLSPVCLMGTVLKRSIPIKAIEIARKHEKHAKVIRKNKHYKHLKTYENVTPIHI